MCSAKLCKSVQSQCSTETSEEQGVISYQIINYTLDYGFELP